MAATIVPDMPREGRIHNPRHLSIPINMEMKTSVDTPELSPGSQGPPPNPPFIFPMKSLSASTPYSRRPRSAIEVSERPFGVSRSINRRPSASPALPDFSFNPGASLGPSPLPSSTDDYLSPPRSPQSPRLSPAKAGHGHKRGGSEFVGGEYRSGNARIEVLSSSPTKSDGGLPSPRLQPTDRRARGPAYRHAHRRSAAMSSHDLSSITGLNLPKNSTEDTRGSSAPSSPSGPELNKHFSFPMLRTEESVQQAEKFSPKPESPAQEKVLLPAATPEPMATPRKSFNKGRVGFSDTLEFIPRPLSLVSSDASSTATVRPGHSLSGSISSIISASNSVIMEETLASLEATPSQSGLESRPSTAGAVLDRTQSATPRRRGSLPLLTDMPIPSDGSAPADPSPKAPKRWSFFGLEHFPVSYSPSKSRPSSLRSNESLKKSSLDSPLSENSKESKSSVPKNMGDKAVKKSGKKQRKVKNWAGSILTKRHKGRHGKSKKGSRRGPTPPPARLDDEDDEDEEDNVSDSADTKSEPTMPTVMITELDDKGQDGTEAWKPPRPVNEDDTSYPMIDLDAALGPFNTPLPRNPEWEAAQKAGGLTKRKLHSAAGLSRFTGPGMHYTQHQRAQSSPEMPPFEFARGISRFGSSSTMADVFEEEEEDDEEDSDNGKNSGSSTPLAESTGPRDSEASSMSGCFSGRASAEKLADAQKRKGSDFDDDVSQHTASMKSRASMSSIKEQVIEEETSADSPSFRTVEFGRPAQRTNTSLAAAPDSPMSSPVSPREPLESSSSHTTASSLAPISPYSTTVSSSFPSPRSPLLYDGTIISTAPSSVTDESFQSLLMGEPGPEVRKSIDVPSLASNHSTQGRDAFFAQQAEQMTRAPEPGERPASFSVMAFGGRRGSLASLSRLISSSHGERSKLSLEASYNSDSAEKPKDGKSKRRLSRMMQFWKPKEKARA